ncbi:MAG: peptide deformylase [Bacilli bacterium]|jgi:peptide deformylase|nr:peptide deformylase [Bacilli bacterium]
MNDINKAKFISNEDIIMEPNDILKTTSVPVKIPLSSEDKHLLKLLYNHVSNSQDEEYCKKYNIRSAVGIAAIQIGINKRLLAVKTKLDDENIFKYALANPVYLYKSKQMCYLNPTEGCLSVDDTRYQGLVPRHYHIQVEGFNLLTNKKEIIDVKGFNAIVLQHEMDHLDGILYIDRINKLDFNYKKDDWIAV